MRISLRNQILVPFSALIVLALAALSGVTAYSAAAQATKRVDDQLTALAQAMQRANYPLTDSILLQTKALSNADFILTDAAGKPLAGTLDDAGAALPATESPQRSIIAFPTGRYFHTEVKIQRPDQPPARLHILFPEEIRREVVRQAAVPPLVAGVVILALVGAVSLLVANQLSRPILRLREQVGRVAAGDFTKVEANERVAEMHALAGSINAMIDELIAQSRAIRTGERLALMGQLSGGLAHQIRNSVAGARLALQLHERRCQSDDPESIAVALRQLRITEEHLTQFLTVGQDQTPCLEECDLQVTAQEAVALVTPMGRHRKVSLDLEIDPAVETHIQGDPRQLTQLISNLLINAVEWAGAGGWVRLKLERGAGDGVSLKVMDSGPGPGAEVLPRLFEPFATGKLDGIGLGLAAARRIAAAHGGSLLFAGNQPTCFDFQLPRRKPSVPTASRTEAAS